MLLATLRPNVRRLPSRFYTRNVALSSAKRTIATSSAGAATTATTASNLSALSSLTAELDKIAPRFEIDAERIHILRTPSDFYSTLKDRILKAEKRIFLSTLYIGKSEHELIDTIAQSLRLHPNLQVSILSDSLRGTRETPNPTTASLLAPLITEFPTRVEIRMYHTPNLTGLKKRAIPNRLNEGWGLQHMKLYGVDDAIIMSGANLSTDYFTNRQDRYHLFSSAAITSYFHRLHSAVAELSYRVQPADTQAGYTLQWPETNPAPEPTENPNGFRAAATQLLAPLIRPTNAPASDAKTVVYPISQFTPLLRPDTSTEHPALTTVLRRLADARPSRWFFTAGYFNPHPELKSLLLASSSQGTVITAAPEANGFYGSAGISGLLPGAYTLLSRRFLESVIRAGRDGAVSLREWRRGTHGVDPDAWTYHAKGVWVELPGEKGLGVTMVGSSNYTKRSYELDLESNVLVVTRDEGLKRRLEEEVGALMEGSKDVGIDDFRRADRRVGLQVRVAMWLVKVMGGQL